MPNDMPSNTDGTEPTQLPNRSQTSARSTGMEHQTLLAKLIDNIQAVDNDKLVMLCLTTVALAILCRKSS
jgi:hypothetical protein